MTPTPLHRSLSALLWLGPMSDKTAIEWTDATWNPVSGCTKKAAGRLLDGRTWDEYPEVAR